MARKQLTGQDQNSLPLTNVPTPTDAGDAANKSYVDSEISDVVPYTGATEDVNMNNKTIENVSQLNANSVVTADNFYGIDNGETYFGTPPGTVNDHTVHLNAGDGEDGVSSGGNAIISPGLFGGNAKIRYSDGRGVSFNLDGVSTERSLVFPDASVDLGDIANKSNVGHTHPITDFETTGTASNTTYLRGDGEWATPASGGSGDVVGPASATDASVALFDGTTGKLLESNASIRYQIGQDALVSPNIFVTGSINTGIINGAYGDEEEGVTIDGVLVKDNSVTVADDAYNATSWNGDNTVPTKNAVRDKFESLSSGISRNVTVTSGNYTAGSTSSTDYVYLIAAYHTTTLPGASGNTNRYTFKNNYISNVFINRGGSDTIEGDTSLTLGAGESIDLISDGTSNWNII